MTVESIIGITASLIAIGGFVMSVYNRMKKQPLTNLMSQLVDKNLPSQKHRGILKRMNRVLGKKMIKDDYIQNFVLMVSIFLFQLYHMNYTHLYQ